MTIFLPSEQQQLDCADVFVNQSNKNSKIKEI
jgi:hypothetical protein